MKETEAVLYYTPAPGYSMSLATVGPSLRCSVVIYNEFTRSRGMQIVVNMVVREG